MAKLNNDFKKDTLAGAKLNVKDSVKAAGTRIDGINKNTAESHSEAWMQCGPATHVECEGGGSCFSYTFDGALNKDQLKDLAALGGVLSGNSISFKNVDKAAVDKILNVKAVDKLNVGSSLKAAGKRIDGLNKQDADSHTEAWMKCGPATHVECEGGGGCFSHTFNGNLTKGQLLELAALGGKFSGSSITFKNVDKAAVEKVLKTKF